MPKDGYVNLQITIKKEDVEILDGLGETRAKTVLRLIRQEAIARQRVAAAGEGETATALIAHLKEKLPDFSKEQVIDLIVELVRSLG